MATLWKRLFVEFFLEKESRSCVFLVIDGLDEAYEDGRQIFFRLLKGLVKDHGTCRLNIQVLLVGRHHITEEIEEAFGVLPPRLAISASKNSKDIERYVRESVRSSVKLRRLPKSLRKEIVDALSNGTNGFFLWAKLMLKEVQSRYHHPSQIRSTLSNLPRFDEHLPCRTRMKQITLGKSSSNSPSVSPAQETPGDLNLLRAYGIDSTFAETQQNSASGRWSYWLLIY